jgi:hypothetical protein
MFILTLVEQAEAVIQLQYSQPTTSEHREYDQINMFESIVCSYEVLRLGESSTPSTTHQLRYSRFAFAVKVCTRAWCTTLMR